jgi:hypothetical protein
MQNQFVSIRDSDKHTETHQRRAGGISIVALQHELLQLLDVRHIRHAMYMRMQDARRGY